MNVRGLVVAGTGCALLAGWAPGCGALDAGGMFEVVPFDTSEPDAVADTSDSENHSGDGEIRSESTPLFVLKPDARYLVPGGIALRSELAGASGAFAWVEQTPGGDAVAPLIVAWDEPSAASAPQTFDVPNLRAPRELALSDDWVVYVDDRFGDRDVFAIDRSTGLERAVARRPGPAQRPAIAGSRVAWAECPTCVPGDGDEGMELFELDLAVGGAPTQRTVNAFADGAPAYGTLADGKLALTWIEGTSTLRVVAVVAVVGGIDATIDLAARVGVDHHIGGLALDTGVLAWRPRPVIVNPDIMFPSDVFATTVDSQLTVALTDRIVARPAMSLATPALAGRAAWLEADASVAGNGPTAPGRVQVASLAGAVVTTEPILGLTGLALGRAHLAFMAPRADNGGLSDIWVLPLGP